LQNKGRLDVVDFEENEATDPLEFPVSSRVFLEELERRKKEIAE